LKELKMAFSRRTFTALAVLLSVATIIAQGVSLRVVDDTGATVIVRGPVDIAYGSVFPDGSLAKEYLSAGLKTATGAAQTIVRWESIMELAINAPQRNPDRLTARITTLDGKTISGELFSGILRGKTEAGDYTIALSRVRSISVLPKK
jgi:hypothetical protein